MKFTICTLSFFLSSLLFAPNMLWSQKKTKSKEQIKWEQTQAQEFVDLMKDIQSKLAANLKETKPCVGKALAAIKNVKPKYDLKLIGKRVNKVFAYHYHNPDDDFLNKGKAHSLPKNSDFAMSEMSYLIARLTKIPTESKGFKKLVHNFIKRFTGKTQDHLTMKEYTACENYVREMLYYKPVFYIHVEGGLSSGKKCTFAVDLDIQRIGFDYPNFKWKVEYNFRELCNCEKDAQVADLRKINARYTADFSSVFTSRGLRFGQPQNEKYKYELACCVEEKVRERPKVSPNPKPKNSSYGDEYNTGNEPISTDQIPLQTVGGGIGLGFENDFMETSYCVTGEYLRRLNLFNDHQNLTCQVGADISYGGATSDFSKRNSVQLGPKIQVNKGLPRVGSLQWVNGLKAQYLVRNNESNGIKTPASGWNVNLFTGLNFPLGPRAFLGVELPVFNITQLTTKPTAGQEYSNTNVSLLLNKENIAKLLLRIPL